MICVECNTLSYGVQRVAEISTKIEEKLLEISEFLRVKALQNIVLGSYPFQNSHLFPIALKFAKLKMIFLKKS